MTSSPDRPEEIAFVINSHLPEDYRREVLAEALRVQRVILAPRGLRTRKVLVVGGAGYIGSVVTAHLLARGYDVRSLDLLLYGNASTVFPFLGHPGYEFLWGDMADDAVLDKAFEGVTDVVLLAGLVGDPITKKYPEASAAVNDAGVAKVIERCNGRGLVRLVFISTCSNYGLIPPDAKADENFELTPLSLYAKSKVAAESQVLAGKGKVDYVGTVLRFATAFGLSARMRFDLTVSEFTRAMFRKDDLLVFDADTWRPYCHVQDFAELIRRVLEAPAERVGSEVFNAGGDINNFTKQMIVDAIKHELPDAPVRYQEKGPDPRNYRVDFSKVHKRLYFQPSFTVTDGVKELIKGLGQHLFDDVQARRTFYGNYELAYPVVP